MKKTLILFSSVLILGSALHAQNLKKLLQKDSSGRNGVQKILGGGRGAGLSNEDIVSGLREALNVGASNASEKLSNVDGFFKNAAIKVLMPEEAKKVESQLRALGMGKLVDQAVLAMNRASEDAAKSAAPVFIDAIKGMSIQDAVGILKGGDFAATDYLKGKTTSALTESFRPIIEQSLKKVDAAKYWTAVFIAYNKVSLTKVNPDMTEYVTGKALSGIFYQLGLEEQKIRKDPVARTTDILKKVFAD